MNNPKKQALRAFEPENIQTKDILELQFELTKDIFSYCSIGDSPVIIGCCSTYKSEDFSFDIYYSR